MQIAGSIWSHLVGIFGTIFLFTAIVSFIVSLIERLHYRSSSDDAGSPHPQRIAVITGASSGLGRKFALAIDGNPAKYQVDAFWLIARREDRLQELAGQLSHPARILPLDLSKSESIDTLQHLLAEEKKNNAGFSVSLLLNCAGYGKSGFSSSVGHKEECRMIDVNDEAAIAVTDVIIPYMKKGSRIGEICSVAAFQPIPRFNCYAASKSFLYSYSRGLQIELLQKGISVTAICPYWVYDTEFISTASGRPKKPFLSSRSENVVKRSLYDLRHHHAVSTPGLVTTLDRIFAGLIPDGLLARIASIFTV